MSRNDMYRTNIIRDDEYNNIYNTITNENLSNIFTNIDRRFTNDNISHVIEQSFNTESIYKNVLSEEGKNQLLSVPFDKNMNMDTCPITLIDFEQDQEVIRLPCNHIFEPEAIKNWVSCQKAQCPVCRFKLDSVKKKFELPLSENIINFSTLEPEPEPEQYQLFPQSINSFTDAVIRARGLG